jgi:cobalamin biosynthesis protein CobT
MGDADDAERAVKQWSHHGDKPENIQEQERREQSAVDKAVIQGLYFETPSRNIYGVREHYYGSPVIVDSINMSNAWRDVSTYARAFGKTGEYDNTPESILGGVLLKMRVAFSANKRGTNERHRKAGKIDPSALGKRAWNNDPRLFRQKRLPGKRDYFVLIGLDVSGSTLGVNIDLIKRAAFAQATLLSRMGIKFAIYAHSGNLHAPSEGRKYGLDLDIYHVKDADEPWDAKVQERLTELGPSAANLDGHSLEYYRNRLDERPETDKILLYFSDGKMPAENHDEELQILQREIKVCRQKGYHLLGVGIRTDSPARHGLDTVQIDNVADLKKVVDQLGKYLSVATS